MAAHAVRGFHTASMCVSSRTQQEAIRLSESRGSDLHRCVIVCTALVSLFEPLFRYCVRPDI
jgi:hypothetical protein